MKFTAFLVPKSELKNMMVKNNFFSQVTWWRTPLRRQDRRLNVANNKTSQASAVGSSPGPDQPFFFAFFAKFDTYYCKKVRKNVSKRFRVHFTFRKSISVHITSKRSTKPQFSTLFLRQRLDSRDHRVLGTS